MSTFEERLNKVDLTPFKESDIKGQCFYLLIQQLYKYQLFRNEIVLKKINRMHYTERTVCNYMAMLRRYVQYGIRHEETSKSIYEIIDDLRAKHEAVLRPSEKEAHKPRGAYIKSIKKKLCSNVEQTQVETHIQQTFKYIEVEEPKYGILCGNEIKMFDSLEFCQGYIDCLNTMKNDKFAKIVKVEYTEISA